MQLLLDTHVLLWWLEDNKNLSQEVKKIISSTHNIVFISAVTTWELAIKRAIGKIKLPKNFEDELMRSRFNYLPITIPHTFFVGKLPNHHQDPFDRMLIAQSKVENLTLMTHDVKFKEYDAPIYWVK